MSEQLNYTQLFPSLPWEKIMTTAQGNGELSHAYILFSKDSEFCDEFFRHRVRLLQSDCGDCGVCRSCVSVFANTSPDFFTFPNGKYTVEDAEKIISECYLKPFEFSCKTFLLRDFDEASPAVQNKLLKVIEEPPKNVYFFITAKIFDMVLPTIRSRAVKFFLKDFEADEIFVELSKVFSDKSRAKLASILAMGRISKGAELYESGNLEEMATDAITLACKTKTSKDLLSSKQITDKYKAGAEEFLYLLQIVYRDILMTKTELSKLVFFESQVGLYKKIENEFSQGALCEIANVISSKIEELTHGANGEGVLDTALLKIVEVKNIWQ
ncbi:MAG: hypothetical protein R3Y45_06300 [Bacillota bacterium]